MKTFIGTQNALATFPVFTSNSARCPVIQYDVSSTASPTFTALSTVTSPVTFTASTVTITPADALLHQKISFYVRASSFYETPKTIGVTQWSSQLVEFYIGCGNWVTITSPTDYSTTTSYSFSQGATGQFHQIPAFVPSPNYCAIQSYEIYDSAQSAPTNFGGKFTLDTVNSAAGTACGADTVDVSLQSTPTTTDATSFVTCDKINVDASTEGSW